MILHAHSGPIAGVAQHDAAAKSSFLQGDEWAYMAGIVLGALLVFFLFPKKDAEQALLEQYHDEDAAGSTEPAGESALAAPSAR
jgi:DHA2 family multidrug resistance protein-like MFS transporter